MTSSLRVNGEAGCSAAYHHSDALAGELDRERLLPLRFARGDTWTGW
jgi:hypothetical protein